MLTQKQKSTSSFDKAIAALADTEAMLQDLEDIYCTKYEPVVKDAWDEIEYKRFNIGFDDDFHLTTARYQTRNSDYCYYVGGNHMPLHFSVPISGRNRLIQEWLGANDIAIYRELSLEIHRDIFKKIFLNIKKMLMKEINEEQKAFIKLGNTYEAFLNNLISIKDLPDAELEKVSQSDVTVSNSEDFLARLKDIKAYHDDINVFNIVAGILKEASLENDIVSEDDLIWLIDNYPDNFIDVCTETQWDTQPSKINWKDKKKLISKLVPVLYDDVVSKDYYKRKKFDEVFLNYITRLDVTININDINMSNIPVSDDLNKELDTVHITVVCDKFENRVMEIYNILKHSKTHVTILYTPEFIDGVRKYLDKLQRVKGLIVNDEIEDDSVADTINSAIATCSKILDSFENKSIPGVYPKELIDEPKYGMTFTV